MNYTVPPTRAGQGSSPGGMEPFPPARAPRAGDKRKQTSAPKRVPGSRAKEFERRMQPPLGETEAPWYWCLHCERTWPADEVEREDWCCPSPDCDGHPWDISPWVVELGPRRQHPEYPAVPVRGERYPLY
jgi:hypothetical protein